jgi:hypothetical protein
LELIGVTEFKKQAHDRKYPHFLPPVIDSTERQRELRAKAEVKNFLEEKEIKLNKFFSYAKRQEKKEVFWINPDKNLLEEEWMLVLNNQITSTIYLFIVPANTFTFSYTNDGKSLKIRTIDLII